MNCYCHAKECNQRGKINEKHNSKSQEEKEERKGKLEKRLYIISIIIFVSSFILPVLECVKIGMYIVTILLAGYEIILNGIKNIFKLNFEEDTLMTIAIVSASILGEFHEACLVILLFKLGEMIEERAVDKSNRHIEKIVSIKATNANFIRDNKIEVVDVKQLKIGDIIFIKPGESVPVDCKIISGSSNLDTSNITGESTPTYVKKGEELLSGSINLDGSLTCTVEKDFEHSTASQIVDLVYEAQNNKGKTEEYITKFSKIYTPIVIVIAIFIAVIPMILGLDLKTWAMRALVFLVASCPCSIVISIPLALYTCLGSISKKGMLVKGTKHIEDLAGAKVIAFDKTGTLTTGKMDIAEMKVFHNHTEQELLEYVYSLERNSSHPIASSIYKKIEELGLQEKITQREVKQYQEIAGCGICGKIDGKFTLFGNKKLLEKYNINYNKIEENKNYLVIDGEVIGNILLKEEIRTGIQKLFNQLKEIGIQKVAILTGDNQKNADKVAKELGIEEVYAGLLPKEKLEKIEDLKKEGKTIFVGDGINDSPVLAAADFSISIGEGTEIANNTADSILISNNLNAILTIIQISRKTMHVLKENITFSLIMKVIVLIAGIMGLAPIWLAVFADVGVTLLTVLNSIRVR